MVTYVCPWCGDTDVDDNARPGEAVEVEESCGRDACEGVER